MSSGAAIQESAGPARERARRIALITATNPGLENTGMVSVDLAFAGVLRRLGLDACVEAYTLQPPGPVQRHARVAPGEMPFDYQALAERIEEARRADAIIFWGDFLHARHYQEEDVMRRLLRAVPGLEKADARRLLQRCLLLADAPEGALRRTILFGGTILHNSQADLLDSTYGPAFRRLVTRARAVWMRDPLSAAKVAQLRADGADHLGVDAALLLRDDDLRPLATTNWLEAIAAGRDVGMFVGSRTRPPRGLERLGHAFARLFGGRLDWVPWLRADRRQRRWRARLGRRGVEDCTLGDLLLGVGRYALVVTDTYHLCVNAWRRGTPAVCIGAPQPEPRPGGRPRTLNDLKKHVFFLTYDAGDFYLASDGAWRSDPAGAARRMADLLGRGAGQEIAKRIRAHARQVERSLGEELDAVLANPLSWPPWR